MAKLTTKERNSLSGGSFALPGRRYPIEDESHARNALARVSQHGSPEEKSRVRSAVHRKFPGIGESKGDGEVNPYHRKKLDEHQAKGGHVGGFSPAKGEGMHQARPIGHPMGRENDDLDIPSLDESQARGHGRPGGPGLAVVIAVGHKGPPKGNLLHRMAQSVHKSKHEAAESAGKEKAEDEGMHEKMHPGLETPAHERGESHEFESAEGEGASEYGSPEELDEETTEGAGHLAHAHQNQLEDINPFRHSGRKPNPETGEHDLEEGTPEEEAMESDAEEAAEDENGTGDRPLHPRQPVHKFGDEVFKKLRERSRGFGMTRV